MTSISSIGKSKKVASRVFGQNIFNEMNASLCYTPSPLPSEIIKKNLTGTLSSATSKTNTNLITSILEESESSISQSTPTPTVLFQQDKENISEKRVSFAQDEKQNDDNGFIGTAISITSKSSSTNSFRNAELNLLRASR